MDNTYDGGTFEFYYFHRDLLAQSERAISMMQMLTRAATSFFNQKNKSRRPGGGDINPFSQSVI